MYLAVKQQLNNLSKEDYLILKELSHISKNLYNQALYEYRQAFFDERSQDVSYYTNDKLLRGTENYSQLQAKVSQQTLMSVDEAMKSFWKKIKQDPKTRLPKYLDKDGFYDICIPTIPKAVTKKGILVIPYSKEFDKTHNKVKIKVPSNLIGKALCQILITPKHNARFFEISYIYKVEPQKQETNNQALAIDLGVNNLCTCVDTLGNSFIMDGKKLKSFNQWYNKEISRLSSIKDKQKIKGYTDKMYRITKKRNNRVNDIIHKTCKYIISYALENNITNIVCGMNKDFQRNSNLGKKKNQEFTQISFGRLRDNLQYLCELYGINFLEQEESYTSKSSFWDKDPIPVYGDSNIPIFSGNRIKRGLYKIANGTLLNADINGALNILRKSNVVSLDTLYSRGELSTPMRIRVA